MLTAAIFDMDGVLIDSHPVHRRSWRMFLQTMGRTVTDEQLEFVLDGRRRDDILRFFLGDLTLEEVRAYGERKNECFHRCCADLQLTAGLLPFLSVLREAGVALAMATSASHGRTEYVLDRYDLRKWFTVVVTGAEVVCSKPDPAIYKLTCARLSADAATTLVIEDAVSGVQGARAAGMKCLGVARGRRSAKLYEAGAAHVVPDFTSLSLKGIYALFSVPAQQGREQTPSSTSIQPSS